MYKLESNFFFQFKRFNFFCDMYRVWEVVDMSGNVVVNNAGISEEIKQFYIMLIFLQQNP